MKPPQEKLFVLSIKVGLRMLLLLVQKIPIQVRYLTLHRGGLLMKHLIHKIVVATWGTCGHTWGVLLKTLMETQDTQLLFTPPYPEPVVAISVHGWTTVRVNRNTNLNSLLDTVGDSETFGVNPTKLPVRTCTLRLCLSTNTVGHLLQSLHYGNMSRKKMLMIIS